MASARSAPIASDTEIITVPGVLTDAQCRDLIHEMNGAASEPTKVLRAGVDHYEPVVRASESCYPRGAARSFAERRVEAVARSRWPGANDCALSAAHFFRYPAGGFVGPHRDRSPNNDDPREVRWRHASLVLFLNGWNGNRAFDGGTLTIYTPRLSGPTVATVISPEAGTLAMFEPGLVHEVTRVRSGTRYSLVAWLIADNDEQERNTDAIPS
jgi:predicted 2-oxoglutarate/Fe(II)-dependent dioxygenase YbiX